MGAIMRESDGILFIWSSAICIISTLSPGLAYFVQRYASSLPFLLSLSVVMATQIMMIVTLQQRI